MTYPKGLMLYEEHINTNGNYLTIPKGVDFLVLPALVKNAAVAGFNIHVQEAYNAYIPCIAMVDLDPSVYSVNSTLDSDAFPDIDKDPYIKILDKLFLTPAKTSIYAIHGIMIDMRYSDTSNTEGWITASAKNLRDLCKERYFDIPVFILTDENVLTLYPNSSGDPQVFLSTQKKLCTYCLADSLITNEDELIKDPTGSPSPNWMGIKYWWYGSQTFDFLSGTSETNAPIFEFCGGTLEEMYSMLNYTRVKVETDTETETNVDTETDIVTIDYSALNIRLDTLETKIDQILTNTSKINQHFVDLASG